MVRLTQAMSALLFLVVLSANVSAQNLKLAQIFSDHMVIQQGQKAPVWGWAKAGSDVVIKFKNQTLTTQAAANGKWSAAFTSLTVSKEAAILTVTSGDKTLTVNDILVGDVWLCSGQSNMEWRVRSSNNYDEEAKNANHPLIRHFAVTKDKSMTPQEQFKKADWTICSPETVGNYTAAGYFFGVNLQKNLDIPIGLLNSSWGGTRIEPWTPPVGFQQVPETKNIYNEVMVKNPSTKRYKKTASDYLNKIDTWLATAKSAVNNKQLIQAPVTFPSQIAPYTSHQSPTMLYNAMLHPMVPFAIKGSIWYQGESNHGEGMLYMHKTRALVEGWRNVWGIKDLPYYFIQIAPYQYGNENPQRLAKFWLAQAEIEKQIPNTGMVVISDIGNLKNIHPKNKQDVGLRLANMALVKTYGKTGIVYHGPVFKSLQQNGDKLVLTFDHVGSGLASRDGKPLTTFEIGGPDSPWTRATATITSKDTLEVSAESVKAPCIVRFAYHKLATPNLMNKEGLPAQTFLEGEMPAWDSLTKNVEESKNYKLIYDLDLNKLGSKINYDVNQTKQFTGKFSRVAYYLELGKGDDASQWVYVSMDAFTDDLSKIGIPVYGSKIEFQQGLKNLNVFTNVEGVKAGNGQVGNIEFWPNNYAGSNTKKIPGANNSKYDFGDKMDSNKQNGYGSMQIHLTKAKQTVFAINNWKGGNNASIGIGNRKTQHPDWTFANNGKNYTVKRLRVLAMPAQ